MEIKILNLSGEIVGTEAVEIASLGRVNKKVLYDAVNAYRANQRQGNASTKTKSEVRGGGKKPWRQKGTGRARVGSIRSPLWRGGGVIFGPKPRDYRVDLPEKVRRAALKEAFKDKILSEKIYLLSEFQVPEAKTKIVSQFLQKSSLSGKILISLPKEAELFRRAGRNIPGVMFSDWKSLNFYNILNSDFLLISRDIWGEVKVGAGLHPRPQREGTQPLPYTNKYL
ncbi:MAG: 50S ribosomal protein L4 [Candidatus Omnitrophota bacterium]|nr:50S ribosomal protein L4 [Candidatus Omnitrophota bacterium]